MSKTALLLTLPVLLLAACRSASPDGPADPVAEDLPGSTRGARVALDTDGGQRAVTFLGGALSETELADLQRVAPNLRVLQPADGAEALRLAPEADGLDGRFVTTELLAGAERLRWVQSPSAGVEWLLREPALRTNDDIVLTNMQGVHGPTIAEHVFAMLLTLTRNIHFHNHPDRRGTWERPGDDDAPLGLRGRTLLVVGLGGIGSEVAKLADGFGMRVLATRRSDVPPPPYVDVQGGPGDLPELLGEADVVVLCVPLTTETEGLIDAEALARFRPGAILINIARGPVVDTDALVEALASGRLAGAGLDVTDPEPLPADHPLWAMDDVIITPHVASRSELTREQWKALYLENLRRFAAGEPLLNVVDKAAGY